MAHSPEKWHKIRVKYAEDTWYAWMSIVRRWAQLNTQAYSSVYVAFFNYSHDDSIELANKIPAVTNQQCGNNVTFKGSKLNLFWLLCHYWSLGSCHMILPNLHSNSHLWTAAVHRTSHRYMYLFFMNKNLVQFISSKTNSVLLPANLLHPFHDARKWKPNKSFYRL